MSVNFTLPDSPNARKPSIFAVSCFFAIAAIGQAAHLLIVYPIAELLASLGIHDEILLVCIDSLVSYGFFTVLPIAIYMKACGGCLDAMRINPIPGMSALLCAFAAVVGVLVMYYISILWTILIEALGGTLRSSGIPEPKTMGELFTLIIFVAVLPGVCEELLFRGAMLGAYQRRGLLKGCVIVAMWFTLLHGSLAGLPVQFLTGLLLAYIVTVTDSLMAGIIYHTVHNAVSLAISYFGASAGEEVAAEVAGKSVYQLVGGAFGIASVLMNILVFGLLFFFLLRALAKRHRDGARDWRLKPKRLREYTWAELAVMCAGGAVMGMFCLIDIFSIAGLI